MEISSTFKRDTGGLRYAKRKLCEYIFVERETGKIWQWSTDRFKPEKIADLRGYPHMANCEALSVDEYEKMCDKIESERYDTGRNQ